MIISNLTLQQFRCFTQQEYFFDGRVIIIEGPNGSGKSSLLEALHYGCYLRSFRTHVHKELIPFGVDHFFFKIGFFQEQTATHDSIQVGYSPSDGKVVKYNQNVIGTYKDLVSSFRIVTLSADDISLVQGAPELRRDFLNYALMLSNPALLPLFKNYKSVLTQRNSLLFKNARSGGSFPKEFDVWTESLWRGAQELSMHRITYLSALETELNELLKAYFGPSSSVSFIYQPCNIRLDHTFDQFKGASGALFSRELEQGRSLFGAHLDDVSIFFQDKRARLYASRGQQKLLVLLIKIAQLKALCAKGEGGVLLLDDFVTDFDSVKVGQALEVIKSLKFQIFISSPVDTTPFLGGIPKNDQSRVLISDLSRDQNS